MDIKHRPDGSVDIRPTKTELRQAEATMVMMKIIDRNAVEPGLLRNAAANAVGNIANVLRTLNGVNTPKEAEQSDD